MNIKLICTDMDGTLLSKDHTVHQKNIKMIKKAREKGVIVAVSTGRLYTSARYYADIIGIDAPVIAANGAYIREKDEDEVIVTFPLKKENAIKISKILKKHDIPFYFNGANSVITSIELQEDHPYILMNKEVPEDKRVEILYYEDIFKAIEENKESLLKCIAVDYQGKIIDRIKKAKEELKKIQEIEVVSSGDNNIEIMEKGVSKGAAVKKLAEIYGFKREEVMCLGDNENDISMLKYAGIGVAMKNGSSSAKEVADYVTDINDNGGVGLAIEKFVIN